MAVLTSLAVGAGLGALSGAMKSEKKTSSGLDLAEEGELERMARLGQGTDYNALRGMVDAGPGQGDVSNAYGAQKDLAAMLKQYSEGGYLPSGADIATGQKYAGLLFQGQREAMNQAFNDQSTEANRQAALMGRSMNDPILRAKLAQEQNRQSAQLNANQGSFATQMALQQPGMRLGFAQDRTNVLSGLATQAMANRQALLSMGQSIQNSERNFRVQTATRWGKEESGGGLKGAISGALGGASMGMNAARLFGGGGGGGGGGDVDLSTASDASLGMGDYSNAQRYTMGPAPRAARAPQQSFSGFQPSYNPNFWNANVYNPLVGR